VVGVGFVIAGLVGGVAATDAAAADALADRLTPEHLELIFPRAERAEPTDERPPAMTVYRDGEVAGYVLSVGDIVEPTGYTGQPYDILLGLDLDGFVTGATLISHSEPLLRNTGIDRAIEDAVAGTVGLDVLASEWSVLEGYAGRGDVSALVMLESIYNAGRAVAVSRELRGPGEREGRRLDIASYRPLDWAELRDTGAVRRLALTNGDIAAASIAVGDGTSISPDPPNQLFAEIYAALATPALIGRNLLGDETYADFVTSESGGAHFLVLAVDGSATILENASAPPANASNAPARVRVRQDGSAFSLEQTTLRALGGVAAAGAPTFSQIVLAQLPAELNFDATRPWALELALGSSGVQPVFALTYVPPPALVIEPIPHLVAVADNRTAEVQPLWISVWLNQRVGIAILSMSLLVLTAIVLLQGHLARRPRLLPWVRSGFLVFTLGWIGWFAGAQLSVMHLISAVQAPFEGRSLGALLFDPLTLILMVFVCVSLFLLGRGVFCGWLCPFGALQELLNKAARRLKVPQVRLPTWLNERLWALKYLLLMVLIGLSFVDAAYTARAVEIEPFNTAILFGFARAWPFTVFAVVILGIGLFIERFFCRYLCPLGAGLAIVGRWRMVEWLKRRPDCGSRCGTCEGLCPVQAIGSDGAINLNECYQCLSCQVAYHDDQVCPPLVARRARRERLSSNQQPAALHVAAAVGD